MSNPKIFLQPELIEGDNIDIAQDGKTISSNTPLANITDTDITEVEDGQALIYDETSGKWVNGEGGTPIEPNPAAAATDTLSTIKIDNTVFTIGGGGTGDAVLYPLTTAEYNALTPEQKMDENVLYLLTDGGSGGGGGGTGGGFYAPDYENPETITLTPLTWVTYNVTQNGYVMVDLTAFTETGGTSVKVNGTTLNFDKVDGTNYILNSTYMFPVMANDVVEIRLNYNGSGYGSNTALFFPAKGEGGGGSNVIPNPEDAATDTLTKLSVDGDVYGIKSYQEITKAEYDALPASKLTDDILYCITDGGATEPGEYYNPVIYSTTEREVGVWTDGRPLYEKTYTFKFTDLENKTISSSVLSGSYALPHEEYERIWVHDGLIKCVPAAEGGASLTSVKATPLNYSAGSTYTRTNVQRKTDFNDSYPFIFIENTYGTSELYKIVNDLNVYVTIRYTKTTDTAGSGKYTTLGVPSVHYDDNEKIIGTWFGETLYEKTIEVIDSTKGSINVSLTEMNISKIIKKEGIWDRTNDQDTYWMDFGTYINSEIYSYLSADIEHNILYVARFARSNETLTKAYITLQYTKTTD